MMGRLIVGKKSAHAALQKEPAKDLLVLGLASSECKAGSKLSEDDKRQHNCVGRFQKLDRFGHAPAEVDVPIRIERDSHRQTSLSTRS